MKKGFVKKALKNISIVVVTANLILGVGAALTYKNFDEDLLDNKKYMDRVEEELDANMKIMEMHGEYVAYPGTTEIIRLAPNSDGKIPVNIDDEVSERAKENIRQVLDEFNEIFAHINDNYNFVECGEDELESRKANGNSTIKFEYTNFDSDLIHGKTQSNIIPKNKLWDKHSWAFYIYDSSIFFDEDRFDQLTDESQLIIIKHEILHALGFADIYSEYFDETSLVNVAIGGVSAKISPNDLKMLYVAYGNKHLNKLGIYDQAKMDEVKKMIDTYEEKYYQYLIPKLIDYSDMSFQKIENDDLINGQTFEKNGITFTIIDDEYFYTDKFGEQRSGKLILSENYVVLADVQMAKIVSAPVSDYKEEYYNDFYVLLKDEKGLNIYDFDFVHKKSDNMVDEFIMDLEISMK